MLYLFNSAARPQYTQNVLKTMFLPAGCLNRYRYGYFSDRKNISSEMVSRVRNGELSTGMPTLVTYIDRLAPGGYDFIPLRWGTLHRATWDPVVEQVYFEVSLDEFASTQPPSQFRQRLAELRKKFNLPRLTNNDPLEQDDGYYAAEIDDEIFPRLEDGDSSWAALVDKLINAHALKKTRDTDHREWVFLRAEIFRKKSWIERSKKNSIEYESVPFQNGAAVIYRNKAYLLKINYIFPAEVSRGVYIGHTESQETDREKGGEIRVTYGNELSFAHSPNIDIRGARDAFELEFNGAGGTWRKRTFVRLEDKSKELGYDIDLVVPNAAIPIEVKHSIWVIAGIGVLGCIAAALNASGSAVANAASIVLAICVSYLAGKEWL